jgi:hypothetical protein
MAKGEQHPFGHDLLGKGWFSTEAMHNPRLPWLQLFVKTKQDLKSPHTMNNHGLAHLVGKLNLRPEGFYLQGHLLTPQRIESTLPNGPDIGQDGIGTQKVQLHLPRCSDLPRMQPHRTGYHVSGHLSGRYVEHKLRTGMLRKGVGVEIEHSQREVEVTNETFPARGRSRSLPKDGNGVCASPPDRAHKRGRDA